MSQSTLANLIDGKLCAAEGGAYLDVFEPAIGKVHARCPDSDARDVEAAVAAAGRAAPSWAALPIAERASHLHRLADAVEAHTDGLAREESRDSGKPVALARSVDIPRAVANLRFFAEAVTHWSSEAHIDTRAINYTLRQPLGVVGCISPWNLPLYLFTWKIAPALAAGNTVVAKPSEVTPLTAFRLSELAIECGFPAGVLNIVHGLGPTVGHRFHANGRGDCRNRGQTVQEGLAGNGRQEPGHRVRRRRSFGCQPRHHRAFGLFQPGRNLPVRLAAAGGTLDL
jgi:aminomuconate-semialdehyde/2-hydroxymuconate-6-semialdehyde dehydrogenase